MKNIAEFTIIGRIGKVEVLNTATRLSIASNYRRRGEDGSYADDTHWNTVVVFAGSPRRYIGEHVARGNLVMARGRLAPELLGEGQRNPLRGRPDLPRLRPARPR